jgi:predicted DCC family thiol-disulfide oxidoreductase YuxK
MRINYPLRIYYDDSCPLCRREMFALKSYDSLDRLELIDCSPANFTDAYADQSPYCRAEMMRLVHARDAAGQWLIGVPVFIAAYGATGITGMEKMWSNPLLRPIWDRVYPWIADNRLFLSKIGITWFFSWLVARAAKKANAKARACAEDRCEL